MSRIVELNEPVGDEMRPIRHRRNLFWWGAIALAAFVAMEVGSTSDTPTLYERSGPGVENEAFLALRLPRVTPEGGVGQTDENYLRDLLAELGEAGHSTLHFRDVEAFYRHGTPLPKKPLLLAVPEAWRETVDAVDEILAETGQRAVLFVDVAEVARVNLSLSSRIRLAELAESGRWEIGIATCMGSGPKTGIPTPEALGLARRQLQEWTGAPVRAADCRDGLGEEGERDAWFQAAEEAGLSVAFIRGRAATNYRIDYPLALQSIPIGSDWRPSTVRERLRAYLPRRERFEDDFVGSRLAPSWVVDAGEARSDDGGMIVSNGGRELGLVRLGGTENWRDARVEVKLASRPEGQFWIYLRRRGAQQFVRLGTTGDDILLQRSGDDGDTRQLARRSAPSGPVTLAFQIVGNRVEAAVDGRSLSERPHEIPPSLAFGPVSLAVWDDAGEARTRVTSFSARPLPRLAALISPDPTSREWSELHAHADELTELSPRSYEWTAKGAKSLGEPDHGLVIFAHFHRLSLRPAVTMDVESPASSYADLAEQILEWSENPAYDGVNLVVRPRGAKQPPRRLLATLLGLKRSMRKRGKELSITFAGEAKRAVPPTLLPWEPFRVEEGTSLASFAVVRAG